MCQTAPGEATASIVDDLPREAAAFVVDGLPVDSKTAVMPKPVDV
jgi:hypothetical protein